jgi:hypothetical protein
MITPGPVPSGRKAAILFTENGLMIDLEEVRKVVENCDVFTMGFRLFPERLIVDTRSDTTTGPMIEVVEPVSSVEERFFWLGQRRPSFGVPQQFTFFVWPHSIGYLEESGLMDRIRHRIYPADETGRIGHHLARAMRRLFILEQQATADAIRGRNFHTLWERPQAT